MARDDARGGHRRTTRSGRQAGEEGQPRRIDQAATTTRIVGDHAVKRRLRPPGCRGVFSRRPPRPPPRPPPARATHAPRRTRAPSPPQPPPPRGAPAAHAPRAAGRRPRAPPPVDGQRSTDVRPRARRRWPGGRVRRAARRRARGSGEFRHHPRVCRRARARWRRPKGVRPWRTPCPAFSWASPGAWRRASRWATAKEIKAAAGTTGNEGWAGVEFDTSSWDSVANCKAECPCTVRSRYKRLVYKRMWGSSLPFQSV